MKSIAKEIKTEIIEKVKNGESVAALAKWYDISTKTIYSWANKTKIKKSKNKSKNKPLKDMAPNSTIDVKNKVKNFAGKILTDKIETIIEPLSMNKVVETLKEENKILKSLLVKQWSFNES